MPVKSGYKTTEFWMTAALVAGAFGIVGFRPASESVWTDVSAIVVAGLGAISYAAQRFAIKHEAAKPE